MAQLQILSAVFALGMLFWSHSSYRRGTIRLGELLFWLGAWSAFAVVVFFPPAALLDRLRINRTMDLVTVVGLMLVWVLVFTNHLENRRLGTELQDIVREMALRDAEKS